MSVRIITGDCRDVLATLPAESVHCVVTSPPSVIEPFAFRVGRIARGDIFVGESHRPHGSHPAVKALEVTMAEKFRPVMASASLPFPKPQYGFCVSALHAQIRQEGSQDSLCQSVARLPTVDRSKIVSIGFPVAEASPPCPPSLKLLDLFGSVEVVNIQCSKVIKSALHAFAAKGFDYLHLPRPIAWMFMDRGTVLVPKCLVAPRRAELRLASVSALAACTRTAPPSGHIASLVAVFSRSILQAVRVFFGLFATVRADNVDRSRPFLSHLAYISQYAFKSNPKYFDIACRRIQAALDAPDLFIPRPSPAVQESLWPQENK